MRFALLLVLATSAAVADPLDRLPAGYASVTQFAGTGSPIVDAIERMPNAPACIAKQLAPTQQVFHLNHVPETNALIAFRGAFDRAGVEACFAEALAAIGAPNVKLSADGKLTVIHVGSSDLFLGWERDWVFHSKDRAQVELALAHTGQLTRDRALMAMANRADRTKPMWAASAGDYSSKPLGIPSIGMYYEGDMRSLKLAVHLAYASVRDATSAVEAIGPRVKKLSPALREIVGSLAFIRKGAEITFDPLPMFQHMDLMDQAMRELQN